MRLLRALPAAVTADQAEVLYLLDHKRLCGRGLGWVDVHLLASARVMQYTLWTFDRNLAAAAESCRLAE